LEGFSQRTPGLGGVLWENPNWFWSGDSRLSERIRGSQHCRGRANGIKRRGGGGGGGNRGVGKGKGKRGGCGLTAFPET